MRRLWWRFFGQGSGKYRSTSSSDAGGSWFASTSTASCAMTRTFVSSFDWIASRQCPIAGRVNLDADEIGIRRTCSECDEGIAVSKADFQDARRDPAECAVEVEGRSRVCNSEAGQELVERAPLCLGDPAGAKHVAPDGLPRCIHALEIRSAVSAAMSGHPFSASVRSSSSARIAIARAAPARPPAARP